MLVVSMTSISAWPRLRGGDMWLATAREGSVSHLAARACSTRYWANEWAARE